MRKMRKTSIVCPCLFKLYCSVLAYFVQMRLFLGLILYLLVVLFIEALNSQSLGK